MLRFMDVYIFFFFSSRRRHTRWTGDWSSDVCSSDLISLYIMAGYHRRRAQSGEAAMKYFVLGAFSSALFLYGIALTYGATGSTNLGEIANFLAENTIFGNGLLLAGMALLFVGLAFKVAAVPFHTWTPDVYQGSPTPATGFMAAVAKAAGFAGLLRVFIASFP